jgi:hypothetical protein
MCLQCKPTIVKNERIGSAIKYDEKITIEVFFNVNNNREE